MALGAAYGGGAAIAGIGVPKIARKADGAYAVFANLAALQAHYQNIEKPDQGYAAVVGTTGAGGAVTGITAAYVWNTITDAWDAVVNDLRGADGADGKPGKDGSGLATEVKGEWVNGTNYTKYDLVRWQAVGDSNRIGIYQAKDGTNSRPDDSTNWTLLFEETYIAKVHNAFDFEIFTGTTPSTINNIGTSYTGVNVKWNVLSWATDGESITDVTIRIASASYTATAAELAAQEMNITRNISRPKLSNNATVRVIITTSENTVKEHTFNLVWNAYVYYGYSSRTGDAGDEWTSDNIGSLSRRGLTSAFVPQIRQRRPSSTPLYVYIVLPNGDELPSFYTVNGVPFLKRRGIVRISGYDYVIYRTDATTTLQDVLCVAG